METSPLSEAQTARLLATDCHRLKSEYSSASSEYDVLWKISDAEGRVIAVSEGVNPQRSDWLKVPYARRRYLHGIALEMNGKMNDLSLEMRQGEPLPQLSVLGTMTEPERGAITFQLQAQDFKDGTVFMKQGGHGDALYIIAQGEVSCVQQRDHPLGPDDEPVLKSGYLLTKQPCECTLTAVGPLKVLVLHRAREQLAALRASGPINDSSPSEEAAGRDAPLGPAAASDPAPMVPEERCGAVSPAVRTQLRQRRVISHVPAF